jgi:membrane protein YdbS with pleckstrin-like domain
MADTVSPQVSSTDVVSAMPAVSVGAAAAVSRGSDIPVTVQEGVGTEGEFDVWEARYSMRNFVARFAGTILVTLGCIAFGLFLRAHQVGAAGVFAVVAGGILAVIWLLLFTRILSAHFGHFYRLTNRRLFVSSGVFTRRRDQVELLRVQDIYLRQSLLGRWLKVGTVVVLSSEPHLPMVHLAGVLDPKSVQDLVWHHARAERDKRSVKVDAI